MKITLILRRLFAAASVAVSLLYVPALQASLLTATYEAQLEAWLGQGNLDFANIFTKVRGDGQDALDFNFAADSKGPTFTLMSVYGSVPSGSPGNSNLPTQVIGGYNPQSWKPEFNGSVLTPDDADRTAFIYNLSSGSLQRQNLIGEGFAGSGRYQTWNASNYGPSFGGGGDITVETFLEVGSTFNYSYGATINGPPITYGGLADGYSSLDRFQIASIEVYTFSQATSSVPDTAGTLGLLGLSLLAFAGFRRRLA